MSVWAFGIDHISELSVIKWKHEHLSSLLSWGIVLLEDFLLNYLGSCTQRRIGRTSISNQSWFYYIVHEVGQINIICIIWCNNRHHIKPIIPHTQCPSMPFLQSHPQNLCQTMSVVIFLTDPRGGLTYTLNCMPWDFHLLIPLYLSAVV